MGFLLNNLFILSSLLLLFIMKNYNFATATRLDLEIWDTQNKIKYIKLPTRKPRKNELILSQTKGVRTNTNRGNINTKFATIL